MHPNPIDRPMTEQQQSMDVFCADCRSKMFVTAAITLALTVLAAGALSLSGLLRFWESAAFIGFFSMLTLAAVLDHLETRFKAKARRMPELLPPDLDTETRAAWTEEDAQYEATRKTMKAERNLILIVGLVLNAVIPIAFLLAIILAAIRWQVRSSRLGARMMSPYLTADFGIERSSRRIQWAGFALWFLVCCWVLFLFTAEFTAHTKLTALNSGAKEIYNAAIHYQSELDCEDEKRRFETVIVLPGEIGAEGTLSYGVNRYYSDSEQYWYAVVCDADGKPAAVYISRSALTEDDLHPPDSDEQHALLSSPLHQKEAIGYYEYIPPKETAEVNTYG